jgi:anti-sigma regulatory factor (Ser/Thr protein kinase)
MVRAPHMTYLREAQTTLPLSREAPREARGWLRRSGIVPIELDDLAVLLVSELVSNSVLHSGLAEPESVSVHVAAFPGGIRVDVVDDGIGFSDLGRREDRSFGLDIVERTSARWGHAQGPTRVWFELTLPT